jgi:hypothetical protein
MVHAFRNEFLLPRRPQSLSRSSYETAHEITLAIDTSFNNFSCNKIDCGTNLHSGLSDAFLCHVVWGSHAKMRCGFRLRESKTSSSECHHSGPSEHHIKLMLEVLTTCWRSSCHKTQIPLCTWHFFVEANRSSILCSPTEDCTTTFHHLSRYQSSFCLQGLVADSFIYFSRCCLLSN